MNTSTIPGESEYPYTVRYYGPNPANNTTTHHATQKEALEELRSFELTDESSCVKLLKNGDCIAWRDASRTRVQWM